MIIKTTKLLSVSILAFAAIGCANKIEQSPTPNLASEIRKQVELTYTPVPSTSVIGESNAATTLGEHADALGVPAASMAVFKQGKLVHETYTGDSIGPDSLFQGASLSKAVASATIVTLALREGISLDEDVAKYITSFDLTSLEGYSAPTTLRELLSHTSGATVEGFAGYPRSVEMPTNKEVILGSTRTNTKRVAFTQPKGKWYYSGGGYQIAQAFAEDVSDLTFAELSKELIFDPIGMTRTTYMLPFDPEAVKPLIPVPAYTGKGPLQGGWHNYPELATAGLWTTATDYGRFAIALMKSSNGDGDTGIRPDVAREMLTVAGRRNDVQGYGLGLGIISDANGNIKTFEHHGANEGYRTSFTAFPAEGAVSIVMTNHPNGLGLSQDANRGIGASMGYTDPSARTVTREPMSTELRTQCIGNFAKDKNPDQIVSLIEQESGALIYRDEDGDYSLVHLGEGAFLHIPLNYPFKCSVSNGRTVLRVGRSSEYFKVES